MGRLRTASKYVLNYGEFGLLKLQPVFPHKTALIYNLICPYKTLQSGQARSNTAPQPRGTFSTS